MVKPLVPAPALPRPPHVVLPGVHHLLLDGRQELVLLLDAEVQRRLLVPLTLPLAPLHLHVRVGEEEHNLSVWQS